MSHSYFDYTKLRNESDIKAAKEKLKYCILVQEEMLSESIHGLKSNFVLSLKRAVIDMGTTIATMTIMNYIQERLRKRS